MTTIRVIYKDGKIQLLDEVELIEGQELEIRLNTNASQASERIPNLHKGAFVFGDDFADPLPDSFWLGE